VIVQCSGLGKTEPSVPSGALVPEGEFPTVRPVTVMLNDQRIAAEFAGLMPGLFGVYQVRFKVPADVGSGTFALQLGVEGGTLSPAVTLAVYGGN
jgi:uncharacterized protein (TIGR03437 family)